MSLAAFAAVGAGAACGAWLRWGLGVWLNPGFALIPLGTLVANLLGGLLMGFALESAIPLITPEQLARLNEQSEAFVNAPSPEEAATRIYTFDHTLSGFSGNTLLPLIFCSFRAPIKELWRRYVARYGKDGLYRRNGELTYILTATNSGANALTNVVLSDNLGAYTPAGGAAAVYPLTYAGPAQLYINGVLSGSITPTVSATGVTFTIPTLAAGATATVGLTTIGTAAGATAGLVLEAFVSVELLLRSGENELRAALTASQGFVLHHRKEPS